MAGQTVELAANFSKGRGRCWGRLYFDLSAAFDSTEFSVEIKSGGARKQFRRLCGEDRKAHCISTKTGKSAGIVLSYKHVGTIRSRIQYPKDDAEAKANSAPTSCHQSAHNVFRNSRISLHFREQLANTLCTSRLKFGVDTWLYTTRFHTAQIHNVRMRIGMGLIGISRFSGCDNTVRWQWKNSNGFPPICSC